LLAAVTRERGLKAQAKLVTKWGALPSTTMLRHRDPTINVHTKERYHLGLQKLGFEMPTADEERLLSADADARYENAMNEVRRRAKADGARLVQEENINYGFVRNLYGLKTIALCISAASLVAFTGLLLLRPNHAMHMGEFALLAVVVAHAVLIQLL